MFIGENLTNLRIMHGYSRNQLSEKLGVTEQTIWQYENGYTSPKIQIVNELKRIFDVKSKYFYEKDMLLKSNRPTAVNVANIAYRSKILNTVSKSQSEAKHIEYLDVFIDYITTKINMPLLKIIQLREKIIEYLSESTEDRLIQIQKAAAIARKLLDLPPDHNNNLLFAIEKSGIFVFEKAIGPDIDAYSLWTQEDRPYIILGNLKYSAARRNFDIAHELGHLLLHYRLEFSNLSRQEHKNIENEANTFACAFLIPEEEFSKDMKHIIRITNPDSYLELKKKWKTSLQVLGYRAAQLGLMPPKEHRNFYAALHRKGYLKLEPLDQHITVQKPMKMKSIIDLVVRKNIIDMRKMLDRDWKANIEFFHKLTGIEFKFFNSYLVNENDFELISVADFTKKT
ncbi:ImmA/IrrE family metallo-endopeptidase [Saccharibacillus sp. JS10]|uniref:spr1629 family repressor/antitoxin n=1 Tax=Saccharibacillus sp. JS10 TaxID=2950552 RepID=UPI00210B4A45|nr:XRE family transcriptional regulator [Saccharibacillus sp. JS10]MCQ4087867.1 XRE family transcriptional regulator [Saccharibacillus sp. JS10]